MAAYDFELFVSYAHGPVDESGWGPLRTWSEQFQRHLKLNIEFFLKLKPRVWFDVSYKEDGVDTLAPVDTQLAERVQRSALFQIHMGDWYLRSSWCALELKYWEESISSKPGGLDRRISIVRVAETKEVDWPALLTPNGVPLPGERCHDIGNDEPWGFNETWERTVPVELSRALTRQARSLAERIGLLKDDIQRGHAQRRQVLSLRGEGAAPLICVQARDLSDDDRNHISEALAGRGIQVAFDIPPMNKNAKLERTISDCAAILILTSDPRQLEVDLQDVGFEWRHLIKAHFQKTLPCAVVDRVGIESNRLRLIAKERGIDWIAEPHDWDLAVSEWLSGTAADTVARAYDIGDTDSNG